MPDPREFSGGSRTARNPAADPLCQQVRNGICERGHGTILADCVQVQKLTIHYNCVGTIEIPDLPPLTQPNVTMQTRKGVAVSYAPMQNAG